MIAYIVGFDVLSIACIVATLYFIKREELYEDPGVLPVLTLVMTGLVMMAAYLVFSIINQLEVAPLQLFAEAEVVMLPMAALCFFFAAFMLRDLSRLLKFMK